jgi:hypothetical protein
MQTYRDAEIVGWIGRLGSAGAEHVMRRFGMGRSVAYRRLGSLTDDGLLEHRAVLFGRPGMYSATAAGLRWQGLGRLAVCSVRPGGFEHAWQVARVATELHSAMPDWEVVSEREFGSIEADRAELFASVQVGRVADRPLLHRPDLALARAGTCAVPVEVELSIKSASRLATICRGWARARHIDRVYYLAAEGPRRAVLRAVRATKSADRVTVLGLDEVSLLAQEQRARSEASHVLG